MRGPQAGEIHIIQAIYHEYVYTVIFKL